MKRLLTVTLLIAVASNLCLAQYRFSGTFYQLRWGQTEDSQDLITPVNALGNPLCAKMGSSWSATLEGVGGLIGWKVSYARLRSLVDGTVHFTVNDPGVGNLKMPGQPYPLPDVPSYVDHAQLEVSYVICYWGSWGPTYYLTPIYSSEVFVVLDAPKAPMNPAWVSLLRYSCRWAWRTSAIHDAAQAITFGVFFQRPGFAYPVDSAAHWLVGPPDYPAYTFMLKALLDQWNNGIWTDGNCVDVSCLAMLALCSVGMDFSTRQLTGRVHAVTGNFLTNPLCPTGSDPTLDWTYSQWQWAYHQICVITGSPDPPSNDAGIWDPTGAQKEDLNGDGYRNPPAHHPNHPWTQFDYWQKPRVMGTSLGLVNNPLQYANDPRYPSNPPFWAQETWKCAVSADFYIPPP